MIINFHLDYCRGLVNGFPASLLTNLYTTQSKYSELLEIESRSSYSLLKNFQCFNYTEIKAKKPLPELKRVSWHQVAFLTSSPTSLTLPPLTLCFFTFLKTFQVCSVLCICSSSFLENAFPRQPPVSLTQLLVVLKGHSLMEDFPSPLHRLLTLISFLFFFSEPLLPLPYIMCLFVYYLSTSTRLLSP